MKSQVMSGLIVSAILFSATHARAADKADNYVYGTAGTEDSIGFGHVLNDNFSIRTDIGHESYFWQNKSLGGNSYGGRSRSTNTINALIDWFPITGSGFRLSGGIGYNNNQEHDGTATPDASGNYHINGVAYSANKYGPLREESSYRKLMPELGIGWESSPPGKEGWRFFSGLNLEMRTGGKTTLTMANTSGNASLQQNLNAEQQHANSDFGNRSWLLNASIGAAYSF